MAHTVSEQDVLSCLSSSIVAPLSNSSVLLQLVIVHGDGSPQWEAGDNRSVEVSLISVAYSVGN